MTTKDDFVVSDCPAFIDVRKGFNPFNALGVYIQIVHPRGGCVEVSSSLKVTDFVCSLLFEKGLRKAKMFIGGFLECRFNDCCWSSLV